MPRAHGPPAHGGPAYPYGHSPAAAAPYGYPPPGYGYGYPPPPGYPYPPPGYPPMPGPAPGMYGQHPYPPGPMPYPPAGPGPAPGHPAAPGPPGPVAAPPAPATAPGDWVASIEAAAEGGISTVTLDGQTPDSVQVKLSEAARPSTARSGDQAPIDPDPDEPDGDEGDDTEGAGDERDPDAFAPPDAEAELQLDLGSGTSRAGRPGFAAAASSGSMSMGAASSASSMAAAAVPAGHSAAYHPAPELEKGRLLGRDPVTAMLLGLSIGGVIALVVAYASVRGSVRDELIELETELSESYTKPIDVEMGELRPPSAIEEDLEDRYAASRRRFLFIFLATGALVGIVLGRLRLGARA